LLFYFRAYLLYLDIVPEQRLPVCCSSRLTLFLYLFEESKPVMQ